MRILHIHTSDYTGGGGGAIAMYRLHLGLKKAGFNSKILCATKTLESSDSIAIPHLSRSELLLRKVTSRLGLNGIHCISSFKIKETKAYLDADVLNLHSFRARFSYLALPALTENKPAVFTLHDIWPFTGHCAVSYDCDRWKTGCGRCPYPREYPKTYLDSSAWMWPKKRKLLGEVWKPVIVTPSRWLANLVAEACDGRCRVEVIPNGIDTTVFRPVDRLQARKELGLPEDRKIVLFAAAKPSEKRKGIMYFFEALKYVQADKWMALAVGGAVDFSKWVPQGVEVRQLGYVKKAEDMAKVYSAADLYCITSLADNFPTTVLESMACGTPVVGFAVGGIPEQVTEECGQLVSLGDAKALGQSITNLLNDNTKRKTMGELCRKRVEQEYNLQLFIERHLALYRELVGKGQNAAP